MEQKNKYLPSSTMNDYYYLNTRNEPQGPHSLDQLAAMMASGRINPTTLIASKGAASWEPLGSVLSRENIPTPDASATLGLGQVGNCPSCGHELSGDMTDGQLPATCPACARSLWSGIPGINFIANFKLAFKNYAKFTGRATRAEYWCFQLLNGLIVLGFYMVLLSIAFGAATSFFFHNQQDTAVTDLYESAPSEGQIAAILGVGIVIIGLFIWILYTFIPNLSLTVRRMHDVGWSGKWLIPYIISGTVPGAFNAAAKMAETPELTATYGQCSLYAQIVSSAFGLFLFVLMVLDSKRGPNKYGPSSKYPLG